MRTRFCALCTQPNGFWRSEKWWSEIGSKPVSSSSVRSAASGNW
jgi:hypothetical protein